jgi:soluble lytic murein transglycosylase-like protein
MNREQLIELAKQKARQHGLDPALVCAVCEHESGWDPNAIRYEPHFKAWLQSRRPSEGLAEVELSRRSVSYGLMQIMGQTAIELGFVDEDLFRLCDEPEKGLEFGCRKLAGCLKLHATWEDGLLSYNGGGNSAYPHRVLDRVEHYTGNRVPKTAVG